MDFQDQLYKLVRATHAISDEAFTALEKPWQEVNVKRKQLLTRVGEVEKWLYFVVEGVQRAYFEHNIGVFICAVFLGCVRQFFHTNAFAILSGDINGQ